MTEAQKNINAIRKRSLYLLSEGYKHLGNICMEVAHRESRHLRARTKLLLGELKNDIGRFERYLSFYDIGRFERYLTSYNQSLPYPKIENELKCVVDKLNDYANGLWR